MAQEASTVPGSLGAWKQQQQGGYLVIIVGDDGARHTMLGFESETQAKDWIKADRQRDAQQAAD
jgi:hypothetical protein